ncbi:Putative serine/threonine-protein kinase/receptor [Seminavis robusta]|uniref:Serine/threonine-protein kinase/receptor n=1 Tax=Seminavis robusta TaxID=568900 RepID=A0A9N8DZN4_9STRA|nr:Putative serine/threonine-protein kinase/receptor [Seminavis robusta]|eukprot:Sro475_g150500.1 Putative serine/threonine-protein kinase/receptor (663) ;mRNA; r:59758-61746
MERVALLNSLGILDMDPSSEEAKTILALVNMAGLLLGADYIFVNLLDHCHRHMMFPTLCAKDNQPKDLGRLGTLLDHLDIVKLMPDGSPFLGRGNRSTAFCNYAVASPQGQSFVVHDVSKDQSFALYQKTFDLGFCSASPIVIQGMAVGALCFVCKEARSDFGKAQEIQQEQLAQLIAQQFETWSLNRDMHRLERERSLLINNSQRLRANRPEDYAALVFTDVQGSTDLWEANPEAMNKALSLHNQIIRQHIASYSGYEVSNEGDAFHVAFVDVVDAVQFCLRVQEALYHAPWDEHILALPDASEDAVGCFRGLRVRMAIHAGDVVPVTSDLSGRVAYGGETHYIAKSLECMSHGGQILVTSDVWNVASHLADSSLGSPQVVDLGNHVMLTHSSNMYDGIIAKNVLQLVPSSLAHDYLLSRRVSPMHTNTDQEAAAQRGRTFPPVMTKKCLSASFHDAPFANNTVAMLFVYTAEAEKLVADPTVLLAALSKQIGTLLHEFQVLQKGYQCKDFMLAFGDVADALRFGLAIQQYLENHTILELSLAGLVKVGVCEGEFTSMGPHPTTGRADYFGKVVNRASRVAAAAAPGCVYLGKEAADLDECNLMPLSNGYMLDFLGVWSLKGVPEDFALYKCHGCNSWYDQLPNKPCGPQGPRRLLPRFQG